MVIKPVQPNGDFRLVPCSDISVKQGKDRISVDLCEHGAPFETITIPDDCEVIFVLSDAKGAKGEKVQTLSLRQKAVAA